MTFLLELPTPATQEAAQVALRELASVAGAPDLTSQVVVSADGMDGERVVPVPRQAFELLLEILGQLANGNGVSLIPVHAELTTQQVADLLAYPQQVSARARAALAELTQQAQDLGLGY